MTPTPIVTGPQLAIHEAASPLSPRAMFNALGNNTKVAWKRASRILSPSSSYNNAKKERRGEFEFLDKNRSLEMDVCDGTGTGKECLERKGSLFGRRSRSSTRAENRAWTGQWI